MRIAKQKGNTTPGFKAVFYLTKSEAERSMKPAVVKEKVRLHAAKKFDREIVKVFYVYQKPHIQVVLSNEEKILYVIYQKLN